MMNLSVEKSASNERPLLPGRSLIFRSNRLKDLKTSVLSGADALDASLVSNGPNSFFRNLFMEVWYCGHAPCPFFLVSGCGDSKKSTHNRQLLKFIFFNRHNKPQVYQY